DNNHFGGYNRNDDKLMPETQPANGINRLKLYLPSRSAIVLKKVIT
ncbi:MAG: hypothetical protein ISR56_10935, partial [Bacteroidales bacterium]|nr:hypothetical protein [Bacteroidales bacterium]